MEVTTHKKEIFNTRVTGVVHGMLDALIRDLAPTAMWFEVMDGISEGCSFTAVVHNHSPRDGEYCVMEGVGYGAIVVGDNKTELNIYPRYRNREEFEVTLHVHTDRRSRSDRVTEAFGRFVRAHKLGEFDEHEARITSVEINPIPA